MGFLRNWILRLRSNERNPAPDPPLTGEAAGYRFTLDAGVARSVQQLAGEKALPEDQVAAGLLAQALAQRQAAEGAMERWRSLTPREQQVAALMCCGLTNQTIAKRLKISPETVKVHARRVIHKFEVRSRADLRVILAPWDLRTWAEKNT